MNKKNRNHGGQIHMTVKSLNTDDSKWKDR